MYKSILIGLFVYLFVICNSIDLGSSASESFVLDVLGCNKANGVFYILGYCYSGTKYEYDSSEDQIVIYQSDDVQGYCESTAMRSYVSVGTCIDNSMLNVTNTPTVPISENVLVIDQYQGSCESSGNDVPLKSRQYYQTNTCLQISETEAQIIVCATSTYTQTIYNSTSCETDTIIDSYNYSLGKSCTISSATIEYCQ
ncbi:hypothetical protein DLAC_03684 [Tieghemostelium lacteum]|uniref:Transmembrane protein n=1 Tax=Tieghemostelium lacteum TaxID=361077 RepID=A0A152A0L5_TIELA|nr:hypothetical protein DLAC_03684 [Tieghemostelium lacteum]|eukprot:KYQ99743.1 hypothetical protein DLAC_03684 [Tieghemostelium lacteum]